MKVLEKVTVQKVEKHLLVLGIYKAQDGKKTQFNFSSSEWPNKDGRLWFTINT